MRARPTRHPRRPTFAKLEFDPYTGQAWAAQAPVRAGSTLQTLTVVANILTEEGSRAQVLKVRTRDPMTVSEVAALFGFTHCAVL